MITFKEFVREALDKPLPFKVYELSKSFYGAEFFAGDREIRFMASNEGADYEEAGDDGEWIIEFGEITADGGSNHGKTGSGNEFQVFATLKVIIEDFIEKCDARTISFSADKDKKNNRARVYAKLFKKNLPPGWKFQQDDDDAPHIPTYFMMVKEGLNEAALQGLRANRHLFTVDAVVERAEKYSRNDDSKDTLSLSRED